MTLWEYGTDGSQALYSLQIRRDHGTDNYAFTENELDTLLYLLLANN